jgi:hypothetical protein
LSTRLQTTAIFAPSAKITECKITAGAEIFVVGYLVGIRKAGRPIRLFGEAIASRIGEPLENDILDPNRPKDPLGNRAFFF